MELYGPILMRTCTAETYIRLVHTVAIVLLRCASEKAGALLLALAVHRMPARASNSSAGLLLITFISCLIEQQKGAVSLGHPQPGR